MAGDQLPERVVVGANGAYWRDFGDGYSMCPVSTDNDPVSPIAVYVRADSGRATPALREAVAFLRSCVRSGERLSAEDEAWIDARLAQSEPAAGAVLDVERLAEAMWVGTGDPDGMSWAEMAARGRPTADLYRNRAAHLAAAYARLAVPAAGEERP